ncbi:hypothetical protein ACHWQZ_G006736 [Mnemiopsis leidyi]
MCLQLGELSSAAANNSLTHGMSFSNCTSPDNGSNEQIKETIESVSRAQTVIENTMKHIVETIVDIKSDIVKIGKTPAKEENAPTTITPVELELLMDESTKTLKKDLKDTKEALAYYKNNVVNILKESVRDLEGFHNSIFGDESKAQIEAIQECVTSILRKKVDELHHHVLTPICDSFTQTGEPPNPNPTRQEEETPASNTDTEDNRAPPSQEELTEQGVTVCGRPVSLVISEGANLYVHLGINDVQSGMDVREIIGNYRTFIDAVQRLSPSTKLIISCPLLNGKSFHNRLVFSLRHSLSLFVNNLPEQSDDPTENRIFLQKNNKFFVDTSSTRQQNGRYFSANDRLHLSATGKTAATSNLRDTVDMILKEFQHRPWL